jgi:hypothetical protein
MSQFPESANIADRLDEFLWREYFCMVSVNLSVMSRQGDECLALVEGGVCDGWLAWFALRAARERTSNFEYWAYDSWEGMRAKDLLPSELGYAGGYEYLDLEQTRRNLSEFGNAIR